MKKYFLPVFSVVFVALSVLGSTTLLSSVIQSNTSGGDWSAGSTWVGGVVPSTTDDVVIRGLVTCPSFTVASLTIQQGATLRANGLVTLTINGAVVNNGSIAIHPDRWDMSLVVKGNVTNNGSWVPSSTRFAGTVPQTISATKPFEGNIITSDNLTEVRLLSDVEFQTYVRFYGKDLQNKDVWNVLNANSKRITLTAISSAYRNGNLSEAVVTNVAEIHMYNGGWIDNSVVRGVPSFYKWSRIGPNVTIEGSATINDTLQATGLVTTTIVGNITNNGVIVRHPDNWDFTLNISGNVSNNGVWNPSLTRFNGTAVQTLRATKPFESNQILSENLTEVQLLTDVEFQTYVRFFGRDAQNRDVWNVLNANGKRVTLSTINGTYRNGNLSEVIVTNAADVYMNNGAWIDNCVVRGNPIFNKWSRIGGSVTLEGVSTVKDTLQATGLVTTTIDGSIVNNGVIIKHPDNWDFTLKITGNITNNGVWNPTATRFIGTSVQNITATKPLGGYSFNSDNLQEVKLLSDVEFNCWVNFLGRDAQNNAVWNTLNANGKRVTLTVTNSAFRNGNIQETTVRNAADIAMAKGAWIDYSHIVGNPRFLVSSQLGTQVWISGTATVVDTLRATGLVTINVNGSMVNSGVLLRHPDNWDFTIKVNGDFRNAGFCNASWIVFTPAKKICRISGEFYSNISVRKADNAQSGDALYVDGTLDIWGVLDLSNQSTTIVPVGSTLIMHGNRWNNGGLLTVLGSYIDIVGNANSAFDKTALTSRMWMLAGSGADSLYVQSSDQSLPMGFTSAVGRVWNIQAFPTSAAGTFTRLRLYYTPELLRDNNASELHVFRSSDKGATWSQVSLNSNITRDAVNNFIEIPDAPVQGMYCLSSHSAPLVANPPIVVSIVGSERFRIGVPVRYTIRVANPSPVAIGDFFLGIALGKQTHIRRVDIPFNGGMRQFPIADIQVDGDDSTASLYVAGLLPGEETYVDVIVYTDKNPDKSLQENQLQFDKVSVNAGAVKQWIKKNGAEKGQDFVVEETIDYIGDKAAEGVGLTPTEQDAYAKALGLTKEQVQISRQKDGIKIRVLKEISKEILEKSTGIPAGKIDAVVQNVHKKVAPNLRQRLFYWLYKEIGLIKEEEPVNNTVVKHEVAGATQKRGIAVTSSDPNEKLVNGVSGEFIPSSMRLTYVIKFENKKEAQAPAWKVVILDTLQSTTLDVESVQFENTSHGTTSMERNGNILRWEFEGIDLLPNVHPPEGEGYVQFSVAMKPQLTTGTTIRNQASITFDLNNPIQTNTVTTTLDSKAPQTNIQQAVAFTNDSVEVQTVATDAGGSGVQQSSVFVSYNNEPFTLFGITTAQNVRAKIPSGTSYSAARFYALSSDKAGNVELTPQAIHTGITTSVEEPTIQTPAIALHVVPQPVEQPELRFQLQTTSAFGTAIAQIIDVQGREVQRTTLSHTTSIGTYTIPCALAPGVYILRVHIGSQTITTSFIKN